MQNTSKHAASSQTQNPYSNQVAAFKTSTIWIGSRSLGPLRRPSLGLPFLGVGTFWAGSSTVREVDLANKMWIERTESRDLAWQVITTIDLELIWTTMNFEPANALDFTLRCLLGTAQHTLIICISELLEVNRGRVGIFIPILILLMDHRHRKNKTRAWIAR